VPAGSGQLQSPSRAVEQAAIELALESAQLQGQRRLRVVQRLGGPTDRAVLGDGDERPKMRE
jgi:hypothetical protein